MAEFITNEVQTVNSNQNVLFTNTAICGNNSIIHRQGSGLVILRGITTTQCRARFKVTFGGNIAIPTGGTLEPISLAIAINGEAIPSTIMTVTPAAVETFFNVNRSTYIDVPAGCCAQISVKNINTQAIVAENVNLLIDRVA